MESDPGYKATVPVTYTAPMILCCRCGVSILSNPTNMCAQCLQSCVDITVGIPKQLPLFWCRNCGRYQRPPWVHAPLESRELLSLCLKKIKGLNKEVKLVNAEFVWTEPHSRRVKVRLTVQKDVNNVIMQQVFVVEFVVQNMQCTDCQKSFTEHTWVAVVQVRQHRKHKRTMFLLEQMLIKHNICSDVMQIKEVADGLDFYWGSKAGSNRLVDFLRNHFPVRTNTGKKLISQDDNSNTKKYKFSTLVEIVPTSKDDLVSLSSKMMHAVGGVSPLMLCYRVSNAVRLVDPITLKTADIAGDRYYNDPLRIVLTPEHLVEFVVLDIEHLDERDRQSYSGGNNGNTSNGSGKGGKGANTTNGRGGATNGKGNGYSASGSMTSTSGGLTAFNKQTRFNSKLSLAEVTVARASDLGMNDTKFIVLTHLGHMLKAGDSVMGYDLVKHNVTEDVAAGMKGKELPDVVLVRKAYPQRTKRSERRSWKLKQLPKEQGERALKKNEIERMDQEREQFMRELEEDPELRSNVNLYRRDDMRDGRGVAEEGKRQGGFGGDDDDDDDDDGFPEIQMDELVDTLEQLGLSSAGTGGNDEEKAANPFSRLAGDDDDDEAEEDGDMYGNGGDANAMTGVQSGRFVKNARSNAPVKQGGFDQDEIEAMDEED